MSENSFAFGSSQFLKLQFGSQTSVDIFHQKTHQKAQLDNESTTNDN